MSKIKKGLIITFSTLIVLIILIIVFISPITKYLVEKYDEKYTGRQITMDWAYVNPFTGYIHFENLKINELKSDSVFLKMKGLNINIAMFKLLSKTYEIEEVTLEKFYGIVTQNKKEFNFSDIIKKFTSKDSIPKKENDDPVHFNILNIKIVNSEFHYQEKITPINYFIKNVNISSSGKEWNCDTLGLSFSFVSGLKTGKARGKFVIDLKSMEYKLSTVIEKFDLSLIGQYLKSLTNYGTFRANLDADIKATGNLKNQENLLGSGKVAVNEFHFGKNIKEDYLSFAKFAIGIKKLSPMRKIYLIDSIALNQPYFKYEKYDKMDNIQTMFGLKGSNLKTAKANTAQFNLIIELAKYVKVLAKNFFQSDYKVSRLAIYKGDIRYNDFSLREKFSMDLNPLNILADSINKSRPRVDLVLKSGVKPYGNLLIKLSINPKHYENFDLSYQLQKLPLSLFNPYTITYTSFPMDRGSVEFKGSWNVNQAQINSINHLIIVDPRTANRVKNKDNKWIPTPLIMAIVRERGNVIDYEIPVTGNLKDPKFHFRDVIFDILGNILIKPITIPYRLNVKNVESEIEKSLALRWPLRSSELTKKQRHFIEKIVDFLKENQMATVVVQPNHYTEKDREYIIFYEAKKRFFLTQNHKNENVFNKDDSFFVDKMSVKDSIFLSFISQGTKNKLMFTIQEKCENLLGKAFINSKLLELNKNRAVSFYSYFKKEGLESRVKILKGIDVIPFNGFSFYKLDYLGKLPESVLEAYKDINEYNEESPRKEYKEKRKWWKRWF